MSGGEIRDFRANGWKWKVGWAFGNLGKERLK